MATQEPELVGRIGTEGAEESFLLQLPAASFWSHFSLVSAIILLFFTEQETVEEKIATSLA